MNKLEYCCTKEGEYNIKTKTYTHYAINGFGCMDCNPKSYHYILELEKEIKEISEIIKNKFLETWLESYVSLKTEDYLKLKEILNIDKGE